MCDCRESWSSVDAPSGVLLVLCVRLPQHGSSYARERDRRDPPSERSLALDLLGCVGLGLLGVLVLGLLVAFGSSLGH